TRGRRPLQLSTNFRTLSDRPLGDILDDAFDEISGNNNYQDIKERTFSVTVSLAPTRSSGCHRADMRMDREL
ncbi:hypothetical protein COW53_07690, partial [bacterium CG17_big_fil_post_rev_8_21_14_2_50_64_8]